MRRNKTVLAFVLIVAIYLVSMVIIGLGHLPIAE